MRRLTLTLGLVVVVCAVAACGGGDEAQADDDAPEVATGSVREGSAGLASGVAICDLLTLDEVETHLVASSVVSTEYEVTATPLVIEGAAWEDCEYSYLGNGGQQAETGDPDTFSLGLARLDSYDTASTGSRDELSGIGDEAWIEFGIPTAIVGDVVVTIVDFPAPHGPGVDLLRLAVERIS